MTRSELSEVDVLEIAARYRQGATVRKLADRFDVSHTAVERALARVEEPARPPRYQAQYPPEVTDVILTMRDEGYTWAQIAATVGMRPGGVRRRYQSAVRRASHTQSA